MADIDTIVSPAEEVATNGEAAQTQSPERRRSGRISAMPKPPVEEKKPAARGGKRKATEDGEEGGGKKAKADDEGLKIGENLPSITLKNEKEEDVDVGDLAKDKGVVLFLVPKADTPGCTTQACGFRDSYPDFNGSGFDVYCLSADASKAQDKWKTKKELPYPLLSDPERKLVKILTGGEAKTARSHFIFEKGGKLVDKKMPVKPADSPKFALEFIKSLSSSSGDAPAADAQAAAEPEPAPMDVETNGEAKETKEETA